MVLAILLLESCGSLPTAVKAPTLAEGVAYVGPATLALRQEIAPRAPAVATVKHGEKLEVLEIRRRFTRVRTAKGVEGWTDANQLLTPEQMEELQRLAERATKLPSQGKATVFEALNMHTAPSRQAPSFYQIAEGGAVEVIAHRLAPRVTPTVATPRPAPKAARRQPGRKAKDRDTRGVPPPPLPRPPGAPRNWIELSRPRASEVTPAPPPAPPPPVPMDDWNLVRTRDGKAGWVLARMLTMAIPDDVAQYAEGHRITSYLSLGPAEDKTSGVTKHNWLWTTIVKGQQPYQFDSFRVFIWSLHRHRYETAYIERNLKGYYPVELVSGQAAPTFALIVEDKDGSLVRKTYAFSGYRVQLISKAPYQKPAEEEARPAAPGQASAEKAAQTHGWRERFWRLIGR